MKVWVSLLLPSELCHIVAAVTFGLVCVSFNRTFVELCSLSAEVCSLWAQALAECDVQGFALHVVRQQPCKISLQ